MHFREMRGGIFPTVCAAILAGMMNAASAVTLYSTSFDNPPFAPNPGFWAGVDGWLSTDPSNGSAAVSTQGGSVYLGATKPQGTSAFVWRPFNLDPVALNVPIVKIRTRLGISSSQNGHYDAFGVGVYNRAGKLVSGVLFDNWSEAIYYNPGSRAQSVGLFFARDLYLEVALTLNFSTNRASLSLFDAAGQEHPVFQNAPLNDSGASLDLGEVDYLWLLNSSVAGDNALFVDSLSVDAQANPTLVIAKGTRQRTKANTYILRGGQAAEDDVRIEWKSKTQRRWTPVRGSSTGWTIHLRKLVKGRNVVQLRMLDALGRTIDQQSVNVLRK